jgi:drug/metabolite transporter (DMT)-like permease
MSAAALLLALASSVAWGAADFGGGLASRRQPALTVAVVSQAAGFAVLLAVAVVRGGVEGRGLALGLVAGLGGGAGLAAFYKALSLGTMSIVSPLVACSAIVPFALSLATGERPSSLALAGAAAAVAGAILASAEERRSEAPERARSIALAVVAALALGLFVYFLGLGSRDANPLSALVGARIGSLSLLLVLTLARREPVVVARRYVVPVIAIGLCDVGANALFAAASTRGLLALVSVLGSLYPLTTILLAHVVLGERLTRAQVAGVATALAGVALVTAA